MIPNSSRVVSVKKSPQFVPDAPLGAVVEADSSVCLSRHDGDRGSADSEVLSDSSWTGPGPCS